MADFDETADLTPEDRERAARADRDAEERPISPADEQAHRQKGMDKTLADSYPASDPPSSIPDPFEEEDAA